MWKLIVVAEAPPSITSVVARTCLRSITVVVSAAIVTASNRATSEPAAPIERVNVPELAAVLAHNNACDYCRSC
jgi:hypothetical protein